MEITGIVSRPLPSFSGAGIDAHSHHSSPKPSLFGSGFGSGSGSGSMREVRALKSRKFSVGLSGSGFNDDGHLRYYDGLAPIRCGAGKKEKIKEKDTTVKKMKKKLKLLKGLKKDLSMFSELGFGLDPDHDLADQVKGKMITEATDLLLQQLQQLKAEEKELKRKRKEDKIKQKAMRMLNTPNCQLSSDSSSESSDSECEQVINMNQLKTESISSIQPLIQEPTKLANRIQEPTELVNRIQEPTELVNWIQEHTELVNRVDPPVLANERVSSDKCCSSSSSNANPSNVVNVACSSSKIEVCMGGKCKKSGALALMEEFQSKVGGELVVGCKCMGKCRSAPNVRVVNNVVEAEGVDGSVMAPANPLCIGVGLEDVGLIVDNFFGGNVKDLGLVGAS